MKILYTTTHSVSIELQSINPYYHNEYDVYLNDEFIKKDNKNIFSLFKNLVESLVATTHASEWYVWLSTSPLSA